MASALRFLHGLLTEQLGIPTHLTKAAPRLPAPPDAWYEVDLDGERRLVAVEIEDGPIRDIRGIATRAADLQAAAQSAIFLLVAPDLSGRARARLREEGVSHIDFQGHVWIRAPGFFVSVSPGPPVGRPRSRGGRGPNPFSKKASLVSRVLLSEPGGVWGVRQMSGASRLSVGYASEVMKAMLEAGYLAEDQGGYRLQDPLRLLEAWASFYDWERNEIHSLVVPMEKAEIMEAVRRLDPERYALTLLAASDVVAPHVQHEQVHLYATESNLTSLLALLRREWFAEPVSRSGNVHVLDAYYRAATFHGSRMIGDVRVVSNEQLFLDLVGYPVRGREAAAVLARGPLARQLDLSREQVKELREWLEQ